MAPTSESTQLEGSEGFKEYRGSGKLEGKSAIITGGDSGMLPIADDIWPGWKHTDGYDDRYRPCRRCALRS